MHAITKKKSVLTFIFITISKYAFCQGDKTELNLSCATTLVSQFSCYKADNWLLKVFFSVDFYDGFLKRYLSFLSCLC